MIPASAKDRTDLLQKNLACCRTNHLHLKSLFSGFASRGSIRGFPSASGHITLVYPNINGKPRLIHSPDNPTAEAEKLIEGIEFLGEDLTILFGFGLGYLPTAIAARMHPDHHLYILEADNEILYTAFQLMDLSSLLTDSRIRIFTADQLPDLRDALTASQLKVLGGAVKKIVHPPTVQTAPEIYKDAEVQIESHVCALRTNYTTLQATWQATLHNTLFNSLEFPGCAPIDALNRILAGRPAVIVAAGPSLDLNLHRLAGAKDRMMILAVDSALRPMLTAGIRPDIVVSVDPFVFTIDKLGDLDPKEYADIPLIFSPRSHPDVPRSFSGPKYIINIENRFCRWLLKGKDGPAILSFGASVAHFAFAAARAMAADPIVFVGLDLAFPGLKGHAGGCNALWAPDFSKTDYPMIPDVRGRMVPTAPEFLGMISQFEHEIAKTASVCIDATEGGAYIRGTRVMSLQQAIESHAPEARRNFGSKLSKVYAGHRFKDLLGIPEKIIWLMSEASEVVDLCDRALKLPIFSDTPPTDPDTRAGCLVQVNRISDRIQAHGEFFSVIKDQLPDVMVQQFTSTYKIEREADDTRRYMLEVQRSRYYFTRLFNTARSVYLLSGHAHGKPAHRIQRLPDRKEPPAPL